MKVKGTNNIYAIGYVFIRLLFSCLASWFPFSSFPTIGHSLLTHISDCSTVERKLLKEKLDNLFDDADSDHNKSITWEELQKFLEKFSQQYPQLQVYSKRILKTFNDFDLDKSGTLDKAEFSYVNDVNDDVDDDDVDDDDDEVVRPVSTSFHFLQAVARKSWPRSHCSSHDCPSGLSTRKIPRNISEQSYRRKRSYSTVSISTRWSIRLCWGHWCR